MRKKLTLTIDEYVLKKYKEFCKKNGITISRRLEIFMDRELKRWKRL